MPITPTQARAARSGFLGLSIADVSKMAGVSSNPLSRFERGLSGLGPEGIKRVKELYINLGLMFGDDDLVKRMPEHQSEYIGIEGFRLFMEDVYKTAKYKGGDIYLYNSNPPLWPKLLGKSWYEMHAKRMAELGDHINVKIMVHESINEFVLDIANHRFVTDVKWAGGIIYLYGGNVGFLEINDKDIKISVLRRSSIAKNMENLLENAWKNARLE